MSASFCVLYFMFHIFSWYTVLMFPLFSRAHRHTTNEVVLLFDVGSGSVGAALALISRTHKPFLLAAERAAIQFQNTVQAKRLQSLMLRALSQATLSLLAEGIPRAGLSARRLKVSGALFVLAAPWCSSRTKTLSLTQKEPLTITNEVISELVRHEEEQRRHETNTERNQHRTDSEKRGETSLPTGETQFERLLLSARLNGYETGAPLGKCARTAAFSFFESRAPRALRAAIGDTVSHFIHPRRARFHSYALASFTALRALFPDTEDFLFVDVGGEMTEVIVVKQRALRDVFSFPMGRNHLIRSLAAETSSSLSAAEGLLALAREKDIRAERGVQIASLVDSFGRTWLSQFSLATVHFSGESLLPSATFLSADNDCAKLFADFMRERDGEPRGGDTLHSVTILTTEPFRSRFALRAGEAADDPFLMLEALYADQLQGQNGLFA